MSDSRKPWLSGDRGDRAHALCPSCVAVPGAAARHLTTVGVNSTAMGARYAQTLRYPRFVPVADSNPTTTTTAKDFE